MTNIVTFPGLGLEFALNRVAFTIPILDRPVYWYGVIIASGLLLAVYLCMRWAPRFGIVPDHIIDLMLFAVPVALVAIRAYYVIFNLGLYRREDGSLDWAAILRYSDGGLAIYGGIIAAVVTLIVFTRKRKLSFLSMADSACLGLVTGQIIGRWGNFMNCEAFGGYTDSLFAMRIKRSIVNESMISQELLENLITENGIEYIQVHPTFLYESMWNLGLLLFMLWYRKRKKFTGEMLLIYLTGYGIGRAWIEGLRTDQLLIPGTELAVSQVLSMVIAVISLAVLLFHRRKGPGESEETV